MTMRIAREWVRLVSLSLIFAVVLAAPEGSVDKTPKKSYNKLSNILLLILIVNPRQ